MEDILAFITGFIFGLFSGLFPGLHSNTIIAVVSSLGLDERAVAIMIISLYPAHLVTSFVPSIFFGIPEQSTIVAVLPGQRMVLQGEGLMALKTVLLSCLIAALLSTALFYLSLDFFPIVYSMIRGYMRYILFAISVILLIKSKKPHMAGLVFLVSGLLGQYALNTTVYDPFLPLFSGMFTMAAVINYRKGSVPQQKDNRIGFRFVKFIIIGVFLGLIADLIPGIGSPSQVATFATIFLPFDTLGYLSVISSISVSEAIFSLSTEASIDKSRMGATAWLSKSINIDNNLLFLLVIFISSMATAVFIIYALRSRIAKLASLDFSKMNSILALYLIVITFILDGMTGILILTFSTALGWATVKLEVERTTLMGAIIIPTLLLLFRVFI